ncbi:hypothetical protein [Fusobacterium varium]|uniref:hypothetical protein n=1 Tax=Fusobacterium varium TaxID=856 RepID=UPI0018971CD6|nr:hypothetical protein [Fusobacterium varium]
MTFYINTATHEVHKSSCEYANPSKYPNIVRLGDFSYPSDAVSYARRTGYSNADGCAYCCPQSHTK